MIPVIVSALIKQIPVIVTSLSSLAVSMLARYLEKKDLIKKGKLKE